MTKETMNSKHKSVVPLIMIIVLSLLAACTSPTAEPPTISDPMISDPTPQEPGKEVGISIDVSSAGGVTLTYTWNADGGEIVRGQGSPAITYRVPEEPGTYNVRVKVEWDGQSVEKVTTIQVVDGETVKQSPTATSLSPTNTPNPTDTPPPPTSTPIPAHTPQPTETSLATLIPGQTIISEDFEDSAANGFRFFDDCWEITENETGNKVLECNNSSLEDDAGGVITYRILDDFILEYRVRLMSYSEATWGQGLMQVNIRESPTGDFESRYVIAFDSEYQNFQIAYQGKDTNKRWVSPSEQNNAVDWGTSQKKWIDVRAEIKDERFVFWLDNSKVLEIDDDKAKKGGITFGIGPSTHAQFDDIRVTLID
jgi:hypothetical protein